MVDDTVRAAQEKAWDEGASEALRLHDQHKVWMLTNPYRADRLATDTAAPERKDMAWDNLPAAPEGDCLAGPTCVRLTTDGCRPVCGFALEGAFFVSAGVESALTEASRTGRDINIAGALYRKVNHGLTAAPVAVEGVETVKAGRIWMPPHHVIGVNLGMHCTECGGYTATTAPCIPGRWAALSPVEPETSEPEGGESRGRRSDFCKGPNHDNCTHLTEDDRW